MNVLSLGSSLWCTTLKLGLEAMQAALILESNTWVNRINILTNIPTSY